MPKAVLTQRLAQCSQIINSSRRDIGVHHRRRSTLVLADEWSDRTRDGNPLVPSLSKCLLRRFLVRRICEAIQETDRNGFDTFLPKQVGCGIDIFYMQRANSH